MEKPFIFGGREFYLIDDENGTFLSHDGKTKLTFKRAFRLFHPRTKVRCKKSPTSTRCYCLAHSELLNTYYFLKGKELKYISSEKEAKKYLQRFLTPHFITSSKKKLLDHIMSKKIPLYMILFMADVIGFSYQFNEFLEARLERETNMYGQLCYVTNIYVKGTLFRQCKYLLINLDKSEAENYDDIRSIDEVKQKYSKDKSNKLEHHQHKPKLPHGIHPYVEFIGHCSNLGAWIQYNYDTSLIEKTLAFPLLKALVDAGCMDARFKFREEIARRFEQGIESTRTYLTIQGYLRYLKFSELETLYESTKSHAVKKEMDRKRNKDTYRRNTIAKLREFVAENKANNDTFEFCNLIEDFREFSEEQLKPLLWELKPIHASCQKCCEEGGFTCPSLDFLNTIF